MLGGWEWAILAAVLLLLFGAKRLPEMARSIGQSARVFKGEMKGLKADEEARARAEAARAEANAEKIEQQKPSALPSGSTGAEEPGKAQPPASTEQPGSQANGSR